MKPETGLILRVVGPVIEVICIALLFGARGRGWKLGGLPVEWVCYAGVGVGFLMVTAGLLMVRPAPRRRRD